MLRFVCLFLLVALSAAGKVKFEDCGEQLDLIIKLVISQLKFGRFN